MRAEVYCNINKYHYNHGEQQSMSCIDSISIVFLINWLVRVCAEEESDDSELPLAAKRLRVWASVRELAVEW